MLRVSALPLSSIPLISPPFLHRHALSSLSLCIKPVVTKTTPNSSSFTNTIKYDEDEEDEEEFRVLTATRSEYNKIVILESEKSKVLLLDDSGNVHSILYKDEEWTNCYWDEFCSLPAIIPGGPVGILGLGGGTVAHQLLHFWPCLCIYGWEVDEIVVERARQFLGLSHLETGNECGGVLRVCVGDALSPLASVAGGYAGIVVDLFWDAQVLRELEEVETWLEMREKLMPGGRIMVNCGCGGGHQNMNSSIITALCDAFGGNLVNWKKLPSGNYLALTGALPDLDKWSASVPHKLSSAVKLWKPCL